MGIPQWRTPSSNQFRAPTANQWRAPSYILQEIGQATIAFSLRKINSGYNGSCIRVRRLTDDDEQDIGFAMNQYLDVLTLLSFVGAGSGYIVTWYDQSGNGYNATQVDTSKQPRIVNSGTIDSSNDIIGIAFNSVRQDYLQISPESILDDMSTFSIFAKNKPNTVSRTSSILLAKHNSSTDGSFYCGYNISGRTLAVINSSSSRVQLTVSSAVAWVNNSFIYDGSYQYIYNGNTLANSIEQTGSVKNTNHNIYISKTSQSGDNAFSGYINSIIVYKNKVLTPTQISIINASI